MKVAQNLDAVLRIYYMYPEIGNAQIREIYGKIGDQTIASMKKKARKIQDEDNIKTIGVYTVNTKAAYKAWGINIKEIEQNRKKLIELGL